MDARPSDSIAVSLRAEARIFAVDELLEVATVEIAEEGKGPLPENSGEGFPDTAPFGSAEDLKEYLRRMHPEDFGRFNP